MYCHERFYSYDRLISFLNENNIQKEDIISIIAVDDRNIVDLVYIA